MLDIAEPPGLVDADRAARDYHALAARAEVEQVQGPNERVTVTTPRRDLVSLQLRLLGSGRPVEALQDTGVLVDDPERAGADRN